MSNKPNISKEKLVRIAQDTSLTLRERLRKLGLGSRGYKEYYKLLGSSGLLLDIHNDSRLTLKEKIQKLGLGYRQNYFSCLDTNGIEYEIKRKSPMLTKERIEELYTDPNLTIEEMAQIEGISMRTMNRYIDKYLERTRAPHRDITPELVQQITNDYFLLLGIADIAKKRRMDPERVRNVLVDVGINPMNPNDLTKVKKHW